MPSEEKTLIGNGVLGFSQAQGTLLCFIPNVGKGRWKVWGMVRHTLPDGVLLRLQATGIIARIPNGPERATPFGPIVIDINNNTDALALDLAVATGAADTASGVIYAQRISPL